LHLVRDYGDSRSLEPLRAAAANPRRETVRGLAAAVLFDAGEQEQALSLTNGLMRSRHLASVAWGALIQAARAKNTREVTLEPVVRRIQFGWGE
jgi:hypothetical protein